MSVRAITAGVTVSRVRKGKPGGFASGVLALGLALCLGVAPMAEANPFSPVVTVNDRVITQYEMDQRLLFLQILRQPGDLPALARTGLIDDRLRKFAAAEAGVKVTPEQIMGGMTRGVS
jgi:peptidyl-prolyl cis-trans isomerase SurA